MQARIISMLAVFAVLAILSPTAWNTYRKARYSAKLDEVENALRIVDDLFETPDVMAGETRLVSQSELRELRALDGSQQQDETLVDPWGTSYRFFVSLRDSGTIKVTCHSAGPDKAFSTKDDIVVFKVRSGEGTFVEFEQGLPTG